MCEEELDQYQKATKPIKSYELIINDLSANSGVFLTNARGLPNNSQKLWFQMYVYES